MPWVSATADTFAQINIQIPYFIAGISKSSSFLQTYKDGFCLGTPLRIGATPFTPARFTTGNDGSWAATHGYVVPALPAQLTAVRVRVGLTGTAPAGNLVVAVWHTAWDRATSRAALNGFDYETVDFTSLAPDATGSVPLASLPSANPADNTDHLTFGCGAPLLAQTDIALSQPVVFGAPGPFAPAGTKGVSYGATQFSFWECFIAMYIDDGAGGVSTVPQSSIVIDATADGAGETSFLSDSFDFSLGYVEWWNGPTCAPLSSNWLWWSPDLLLTPASASGTSVIGFSTGLTVSARRARSYALVIGD